MFKTPGTHSTLVPSRSKAYALSANSAERFFPEIYRTTLNGRKLESKQSEHVLKSRRALVELSLELHVHEVEICAVDDPLSCQSQSTLHLIVNPQTGRSLHTSCPELSFKRTDSE